MTYSVANPPPGYTLKPWDKKTERCTSCAGLNDGALCVQTRCSSSKNCYIVVKATLRDFVTEAVK